MQHKFFDSVATRVTLTLVLVATFFLSVGGWLLYKQTENRAWKTFFERMEINASALGPALALPVSENNTDQVRDIIWGAMKDGRLYGVVLQRAGNRYFYARDEQKHPVVASADFFSRQGLEKSTYPITLNGREIAQFTLYMNTDDMNASLSRWRTLLVAAIVLIDMLLVIVLYSTLWVAVLYPLGLMKNYAESINSVVPEESGMPLPRLWGEFKIICSAMDRIISSIRLQVEEVARANQRFDRMSRKFPMPIGICDPATREVQFINERFIEMLGYEPADIPTLDAFNESVYPDPEYRRQSQEAWTEMLLRAREKDVPIYPVERVMRCKNGEEKIIELSGMMSGDDFLLGIFNDVTDRKNAESEVLKQRDHLRELTSHVQDVREEERKRIAQELHDELGQILTVARIDLSNLEELVDMDDDGLRMSIERLVTTIDSASDAARRISENLRPGMLDLLGLGLALELHINRFIQSTQIDVELTLEGDVEDGTEFDIDDRVATTAFRIVQEALTNVLRYAEANRVSVHVVNLGEELVIVVRDNGIGFDQEQPKGKSSFGLLGMRERAEALHGSLTIETAPGEGVRIEASLPLENRGEA